MEIDEGLGDVPKSSRTPFGGKRCPAQLEREAKRAALRPAVRLGFAQTLVGEGYDRLCLCSQDFAGEFFLARLVLAFQQEGIGALGGATNTPRQDIGQHDNASQDPHHPHQTNKAYENRVWSIIKQRGIAHHD